MSAPTRSIDELVEAGTLERLATGFGFTEGPIWHPDGHLLFSDMPQDVRRRWDPAGGISEAMRPSNKCNGMTLTRERDLIVCEHATSMLVCERSTGEREVLASHWGERELNAPNDVVVGADGSIYFSDPIYGRLPEDGVERDQELDFQGLFRVTPAGELELLADDFGQPNGLCFSPDFRTLYVNDTPRCHIRAFAVRADGSLAGGEVFHDGIGNGNVGPTGVSDDGVPDGMKCDEHGNVYCTGPGGVWAIAPDGTRIGTIEVPEIVANLTFGDADWKTLYLTATTSLYRLRMRVSGRMEPYMEDGR
ncbi:MAG: SMP-30/gluconolactonase/LRE family protein [Actinobacteria bacterium]|nr:SMP-30/gluconolactonase/LRE family protein [Actinomycetota bacterium]